MDKMNIEIISTSDLAKRYLSDESGKPLSLEEIQKNFSDDQKEAAKLLYDKIKDFHNGNTMLLYGEKDGKPFIYELTEREYLKYNALDEDRREKYLQHLLSSKEAETQKIAGPQTNKAADLSTLVTLVDQDYDGKELIEGELRNGNTINVSNINVHQASELLVKMNDAGTKEQIPQETLDRLNGRYLMTALVNGHTVSHVIDKETYDRFASLNEQQRLKEFRKVYGIPENRLQAVENKKFNASQSGSQIDFRNMGILGLLMMLLQCFGYKPDSAQDMAQKEVAEAKQQTTSQQSVIIDRSVAEQVKTLAEANAESRLADLDEQQQSLNKGLKL